jgi:hypothetical protein
MKVLTPKLTGNLLSCGDENFAVEGVSRVGMERSPRQNWGYVAYYTLSTLAGIWVVCIACGFLLSWKIAAGWFALSLLVNVPLALWFSAQYDVRISQENAEDRVVGPMPRMFASNLVRKLAPFRK